MKSKPETVIALKNILDAAREAGAFSMFLTAVQSAGLEAVLRSERPVTVFAPVDRAFEKLPKAVWERLLGNKKEMAAILTYHMVPGKLTIGAIMALATADTVQGQKLRISSCDGLMINEARVIKADIDASNGIIHGIDTMLKLPSK